jgi:photosystem II stability/assembly factor-like uncharacterized protein
LLHYSGGRWQSVASPVEDALSAVAMVSAMDGWIVGGLERGERTYTTVLLRYQNGQWTPFENPTRTPLRDVAMLSADEGWAVGEQITLHYRGGAWEREERPGGLPPYAVAAAPPDEAWAVGLQGAPPDQPPGLISTAQHYQGGGWAAVTDPAPPGAGLLGIDMLSASEGWAVGRGGTIVHYQDGAWSEYRP